MASVFVGTGYNQVVQFQTDDKSKSRNVYGVLAKAPVRNISVDLFNDRLLYATSRTIVAAYSSGEVQQVCSLQPQHTILKSEYIHPHAFVRYCLSNGAIRSVSVPSPKQEGVEE